MAITVVGDTLNLGASATTNIQPPSGQTYLLKAVGSESPTAGGDAIELYDGTDNAPLTYALQRIIEGSTSMSPVNTGDLGIPLTNSQYARLVKGGNAGDMGWRGVRLDV